jgi:AraC-like DNA-binding protein
MKDVNKAKIWRLEKFPAGVSAWPEVLGHLIGGGSSRYRSLPDYFCPHVITKGCGFVRTSKGLTEVKPGDMFTLWPGVEIEYFEDPRDSWEFYYMHVVGSASAEYLSACGFRKDLIALRPKKPDAVIKCFLDLYKLLGKKRKNAEFKILSSFYELPGFCAPPEEDESHDILAQALSLIDSQLAIGINVNELCSFLSVSRVTLFRLFRERLNSTPSEMITRARIKKSRQLLRETPFNISAIAEMTGFSSEKYFMRAFKKATGKTPTEYRGNR